MSSFIRRFAALLLRLTGFPAGCSLIDGPVGEPLDTESKIAIPSFALSLENTSTPATKMVEAITQTGTGSNVFRGVSQMYLIPFHVDNRDIAATDERYEENVVLLQNGAINSLIANNNAHLYQDVVFKSATTSVLAYGRAKDANVSVAADSVAFRKRNGALHARHLTDAGTPAAINFELQAIATDDNVDAGVSSVLSYLNSIAATEITNDQDSDGVPDFTYRWSDASTYMFHPRLKNAFLFFTAYSQSFPAGGDALGRMLTLLYQEVGDLANQDDWLDTYIEGTNNFCFVKELATAIKSRIDDYTYISKDGQSIHMRDEFPVRLGLPAGSLMLRWVGDRFLRPTRAMGDGAARADAFRYPPEMWYYVNSPLLVSDSKTITSNYNAAHTTWKSITDDYKYNGAPLRMVVWGTESVAIEKPLQYGTALLKTQISKVSSLGNSTTLPDNKGNAVNVEGRKFPLTGILIGNQRRVGFDFTPVGDDETFIYDAEVYDGNYSKAYITSSSDVTFSPIHTLVLQTPAGEDVPFALEFRNNSGSDFYGHDGQTVFNGGYFYLFGMLEYSKGEQPGSTTLGAVFVQDHVTKVTFRITSLAEAYVTIPDLHSCPMLEMGVRAEINWTLSTPIDLPLI